MNIQSLHIRTYVLAAALTLGLILSGVAYADNGVEKVLVCHKGKNEIVIGEPAVAAHLAQGGTLGACTDGGGGGGDDGPDLN